MPERVHLDRIEGERAVLVAGPEGRETLEIPARLLPQGAKEGAALDLSLSPASQDTARAEVNDLMGELFGEQDPPVPQPEARTASPSKNEQ